jgi:hypothetical protein
MIKVQSAIHDNVDSDDPRCRPSYLTAKLMLTTAVMSFSIVEVS